MIKSSEILSLLFTVLIQKLVTPGESVPEHFRE